MLLLYRPLLAHSAVSEVPCYMQAWRSRAMLVRLFFNFSYRCSRDADLVCIIPAADVTITACSRYTYLLLRTTLAVPLTADWRARTVLFASILPVTCRKSGDHRIS
jgi:hypothetical protein